MHRAALRTGAILNTAIEFLKQRRQVFNNVRHLDLNPVNQPATIKAKPLKSIKVSFLPCAFNNQPDRPPEPGVAANDEHAEATQKPLPPE